MYTRFRPSNMARNRAGGMASGSWPVGADASIRGQVSFEQDELDQRFLQCSVCYDKFDTGARVPKMLPGCHHTFCQACLQELLNAVRPTSSSLAFRYQGYVRYVSGQSGVMYPLTCPACRQISSLNTRNAHTLQTDYKVLDMMDFFSKCKKVTTCSKHAQPLNFFCERCIVPICRDCTVLDHREREGHNFLDIREAFNRFESDLKNQVGTMQDLEKQYEDRETALRQQLQELSDSHMTSENGIDDFFDDCVRQIEGRRAQLKQDLNDAVENDRTHLQECLETVAAKRELIQDKASALDAGISGGNLHEAFSIHKELREHAPIFRDDSAGTGQPRMAKFTAVRQDDFDNLVHSLGRVDQTWPPSWERLRESPPPPSGRVSVGTNTGAYRSASVYVNTVDEEADS